MRELRGLFARYYNTQGKVMLPTWMGIVIVIAVSAASTIITRLWWDRKNFNPRPDPEEAWCLNCKFVEGSTFVMPAENIKGHLNMHQKKEYVHVLVTRK